MGRKHLTVKISNTFKVDNVLGVFDRNTLGNPLEIKPQGNGAMIPFPKQYIGCQVIVLVLDKQAKCKVLTNKTKENS